MEGLRAQNPCVDYLELDEPYRSINYKKDTKQHKVLCDFQRIDQGNYNYSTYFTGHSKVGGVLL